MPYLTTLRYCLPVVLLLGAPVAIAAEAAQYRLDPVHTRVMFAVSHAGFSHAIGTVSGSTGTLLFDPNDWATARLEVNVPLERIDLGDAEWNKAVIGRKLLYVSTYPAASFVSTRIEPIDPQHASVFGTLKLHGVSKEIKLDVKLNALKRHPMPPFRHTAGFTATATLNRKDFGIDAWPGVIGDSVELRIEAEAAPIEAARDAQPGSEATQPPTDASTDTEQESTP